MSTKRVNLEQLEGVISRINQIKGAASKPYIDGKPQAGCHYLSGDYGGWRVERIAECGGTWDALSTGYVSKKELYYACMAYIAGIVGDK